MKRWRRFREREREQKISKMSLPRGRQPDLPLVTPGGGDDGARGIHVITPISCRSCAVIVAPSVGQYAAGVRHLGNIKITPGGDKTVSPRKTCLGC